MAKRSVSATTTQSTELFKELTAIFALEIFISDSSIHAVLPLQKFKSLFKHKIMDMKQVLFFLSIHHLSAWNSLPPEVVNSDSLELFKVKLIDFYHS